MAEVGGGGGGDEGKRIFSYKDSNETAGLHMIFKIPHRSIILFLMVKRGNTMELRR